MNKEKRMSCQQSHVIITHADLPLSCPMPGQEMWNAHPREFLPIEATGKIKCPYCGTVYVLQQTDSKS